MTGEFAAGARGCLASFSPLAGAATAAVVMLLGGLLSKRMAAARLWRSVREWSARSLRKDRSHISWRRWLHASWLAQDRGDADQGRGQARLARETSAVMRNTGGE